MLLLYTTPSPVCNLFKELTRTQSSLANNFYLDQGYKTGYPWLYYDRTYEQIIQEPNRIKFHASFSYEAPQFGIISKLKFKLASYDFEGNFLGFSDMTNQLVICEEELQ